ncbi:MAG: TetR/AcrR family transcriptional regulator [Rhodospirillaceae bacterium]|jgi:AcrR family transcriptional regulator|nr:TetR/AcrR family transcriptional regulator [Rhodospirillaceae bacterium]MBT3808539.1 TetR/AcrR family transcriptional regulator [Rhodospirillaceae bacterium]MBT3931790.1 TetR/AcrR family transcriptional regulator [Rhodospirillaceae bacterium]MBT4771724.1 TetR/AcrR family transcriptional regulator [Rhodospirillaceae bacterium]MBT5357906.1 TetR/AcrR family transcriptional regulator [Rhodospirillaceae bacterium]
MNNNSETPKRRSRGRPRAFDREEVLDRAIEIFWAKGYGQTSVEELTSQMGISPPSLYAAFGNKHDLFMHAMDRYAETVGGLPTKAFADAPDVRSAVQGLFETTIRCATTTNRPKGCLLVSVASEMAVRDEDVRKKLAHGYATRVKAISDRVAAEQGAGRLPTHPTAERLAKMIVSVTHGLVARARMGANRSELSGLASDFLDTLVPASD